MRDTSVFLSLMTVWVVSIGAVLLLTEKHALHLTINAIHHPGADIFFKYITHLGDGLVVGVVVVLALIYKVRYGLIALVGIGGAGLLSQLLKRQLFHTEKRPSKVFENIGDLRVIEGIDLHSSFSFPSGHATVAFGIFFFLSLITKSNNLKAFCFTMATITAFSRVYISQHFLEDVYAGSLLGTGVLLLVFAWLREKRWGEKGLVDYFDTKR